MTGDVEALPLPRPQRTAPVVESEVLAMVIFVFTEVMFFAGLISGYSILKGRAIAGIWPPVTDPDLPAAATAVSTVALLLSGGAVFLAGRKHATDPAGALKFLWAGLALASGFVSWQVIEAVQLLSAGLTMVSSAHGGFFYTIVGAHAIHAVVAIGILANSIRLLSRAQMTPALFRAIRIFWYFVVGLWPFLYTVIYL